MRKLDYNLRRLLLLRIVSWIPLLFPLVLQLSYAGDIWPLDRPDGMPAIQSLEVMCGKDHMDVHLSFSAPFEGIVSSKGQHGDPRCIYVHPSSGQKFFSFRIAYARCGTKPDLHGQFYENTVVVQYDKDLLEVWDEAKRLRCEWFNDYEKTASKPPMVIADLDVIQLDFRGDNVDCWMEIQHGKGPWAPPVSGIVPLGSTLTLVVAINDYRGEFDMRVKSCVASDGGGHVIQLSDEFGCVLRPKMISRFLKAKGADERASVITYAFFHAFKFPDALSVHIKCKVEICRHGCLDHCQLQPDKGDIDLEISHYMGPLDRKDNNVKAPPSDQYRVHHNSQDLDDEVDGDNGDDTLPGAAAATADALYDDIIQSESAESGPSEGVLPTVKMSLNGNVNKKNGGGLRLEEQQVSDEDYNEAISSLPQQDALTLDKDQFPQGPRFFEEQLHLQQQRTASIGGPRSFPDDMDAFPASHHHQEMHQNLSSATTSSPATSGGPMVSGRKRRSVVVSDKKARSTDVGVSGLYEVISEADLAFSPDSRAEAVTVFQGKIREEVVYGICMPVPGFSVLFIMVAISAVVSALVAGSLLYRYQLQKEHIAAASAAAAAAAAAAAHHLHQGHGSHHHPHQPHWPMPMSALVNWVGVHFLRMRPGGHHQGEGVGTSVVDSGVGGDREVAASVVVMENSSVAVAAATAAAIANMNGGKVVTSNGTSNVATAETAIK